MTGEIGEQHRKRERERTGERVRARERGWEGVGKREREPVRLMAP